MTVLEKTIRLYLGHNRLDMFPLKHPNSGGDCKTPLHTQWTTRYHSPTELKRYALKGHGIGWQPGIRDLVIDIDPRNGGLEGRAKLLEQWGVEDLSILTPTVLSGRGDGGSHYYLRMPQQLKLRKTVKELYTGVDFITRGKYVILPGSIHPATGNPYTWDIFCDPAQPPLDAPDWLLEQLQYKPYTEEPPTAQTVISTEELTYLLSQLPVEEYDTNAEWEPIMMAAHHGTRGIGIEAFLDWCLGDTKYQDDTEIIRSRWRSLRSNRASSITVATLYKEVIKRGGKRTTFFDAKDDFGDEEAKEQEAKIDKSAMDELVSELNKWAPYPATPAETVKDLIRRSRTLNALDRNNIRKAMAQSLGVKVGVIDQMTKEVEADIKKELDALEGEQEQYDWSAELARYTLKHTFKNRHLINAQNQMFYRYTGTHWEPLKKNVVLSCLYKASIAHKRETGVEYKISQALPQAERVLIALTATGRDVFRFTETPPSVVNTKNFELWIDPDTGEVTPREHSPESYLTTCLGVRYDPDAECKLFDSTLASIFAKADEPEEMVRHIWEIFGYIIQPLKNIPAWFILHGSGANGKSVIMDVLTALVGPTATLPRSVHDFAGGNNAHALASFPGKLLLLDDDADTSIKLPEAWLKKFAEGKMLEANPKGTDTYNFRSIATPILCANDWPIIHALNHGMLRRANAIPFRQRFVKHERDLNRARTITGMEMPGVLNSSLEGYRRLRARGDFDRPKECERAVHEWLISGNTILRFVDQCTKPVEEGYISLEEIYHEYEIWCHDFAGVKRPANRSIFETTLTQQDYVLEEIEGQTAIRGIAIIEKEEF